MSRRKFSKATYEFSYKIYKIETFLCILPKTLNIISEKHIIHLIDVLVVYFKNFTSLPLAFYLKKSIINTCILHIYLCPALFMVILHHNFPNVNFNNITNSTLTYFYFQRILLLYPIYNIIYPMKHLHRYAQFVLGIFELYFVFFKRFLNPDKFIRIHVVTTNFYIE